MREIGDAAGILSGSLYHHFPSKDAIVREIIADYVDEVLCRSEEVWSTFPDDPEKCLRELFRASFDAMAAHHWACTIFQKDFTYVRRLPEFEAAHAKVRRVGRIWLDVLAQGIDRGAFRDDVDPRLFINFARDALCNSVHWLYGGRPHDLNHVRESCTNVFLNGCLTRPA